MNYGLKNAHLPNQDFHTTVQKSYIYQFHRNLFICFEIEGIKIHRKTGQSKGDFRKTSPAIEKNGLSALQVLQEWDSSMGREKGH